MDTFSPGKKAILEALLSMLVFGSIVHLASFVLGDYISRFLKFYGLILGLCISGTIYVVMAWESPSNQRSSCRTVSSKQLYLCVIIAMTFLGFVYEFLEF